MSKIIASLWQGLLYAVGIAGFLLLLAFGLVQIWLGWTGIEYHLGTWWAAGFLFLAFVGRIMLPLTIGCYFGVVDVVGWPWWAGALIAAPGLLLATPALAVGFGGMARDAIRGRRNR